MTTISHARSDGRFTEIDLTLRRVSLLSEVISIEKNNVKTNQVGSEGYISI